MTNTVEIPDKLFKCYAKGMGCDLIKMSVFDKLTMPYFFYTPWTKKSGGHGEDIWFHNLAREAGIPEDIVDDRFLEEIKGGVGDLLAVEIKKFMREITG